MTGAVHDDAVVDIATAKQSENHQEPVAKRAKLDESSEKLEYFDSRKRTDAAEFDIPTAPHPPELYQASSGTADQLNSVRQGGLSAVTEEHVAGYGKQAHLVIEDAWNAEQVEEILQALREVTASEDFQLLTRRTAAAQAAGQVELSKGGLNPVLQFESFAREIPDGSRYRLENVRKLMGFHKSHETLEALATNQAMLSVARRLLVEAGCTPEQVSELEVFQSLALLKPPGGREKPWHQDNAYFDVDHSKVKMIGVWIALTEVTVDSGAMHVLPAPLAELQPVVHFSRRDFQICDSEVLAGRRPCVAVPLRPGGMLFFSTMLPHGTPTNTSSNPRYAVQFHFIPRCFTERTSGAARKAVFGEESQPGISC